ncbi:MAG: hypothetical protein ABIN48_11580 [Ginsengibacter sp.]
MEKSKQQINFENTIKKADDRIFENEQLISKLKNQLSSFNKGKSSTKGKVGKTNEEIAKLQSNKILKENEAIIKKVRLTKQKRHVKEPQEKVFKAILNDFTVNYANLVVANTTKEIIKFIKE